MEKLQRLIYIIAGLNLAWGTGEFTLHAFADPVAGWRNAIVTVACVELLFVLLVVAAKQRKINGWWSVAPLAVTAMVQAAKVSGDVMAAKSVIEGVLMVAVAVASVLALACVVYLFELRSQTPAQASPDEQGEAFDPAALSEALRNEWRAELAQLTAARPTQAVQVNVTNGTATATETETETETEPAQPEITIRKQPKPKVKPLQLVSGDTWQAKVLEMVAAATKSGTKPNYTHIAATVGKSRTAVADAAKAVQP